MDGPTILAFIRRKFSTPPVVAFKFPEEYLCAKKVGHINATFRVLNFGTGIPESSESKDLPMRLFSSSVINLEEIEIRGTSLQRPPLNNGHSAVISRETVHRFSLISTSLQWPPLYFGEGEIGLCHTRKVINQDKT